MCLAIPGKIKSLDEKLSFATVEVSGVTRKVNVELLREDGLTADDWVLIHVGFAMSKISAEEAQEQLRLLDMLGETDAALEEVQGYGAAADPYDPLGENPFSKDGGAEEHAGSKTEGEPPENESMEAP